MTEENPVQTPKKKRPVALIIVIAAIVVAAIGAGAFWYFNIQVPHQNAVEAYDSAVEGLTGRNAELDAAITDLQNLMNSGEAPLDATLSDASSAAIGQAQGAKQEAPAMPEQTDEINTIASEIDSMGQYTEELNALKEAQTALQNSIDQMKLVTNPTEQFVIERLTGLPNITGMEAVTEATDPNGQLNKDGGYTATVYFSSDLVDSSRVYGDPNYSGIIGAGCDGGGAIEVYANAEDAQKRETYLAAFDGSLFSSGSHTVAGTCVVRTSNLLTASQQDVLEQSIVESLTKLS